ncbi:ABC transporter ATP-binding protein [bacterium]|nr:ABC transporter ATP-binding protein [bacterium]
MEKNYILEVKDLKTYFKTPEGIARAVDGVSFGLKKGEVFALVGESGCGKSVTALSIMQILPKPAGFIEGGEILFEGQDILKLREPAKRKIRGDRISMIFQEPETSLNPVFSVGNQVDEVFAIHKDMGRGSIREKTVRMLKTVGIPDPDQRVNEYPHQLSGGMKQRVMIAMALGCEPDILIADEPTTALDVTIQAQVLTLIDDLREKFHTSVLLITHDLGVVRQQADRIGVMYAGKIVEQAEANELFENPLHPYTKRLLESLPSRMGRGKRLSVISGSVPSAVNFPKGCRFAARCHLAREDCRAKVPLLKEVGENHQVACLHYESKQKMEECRVGIAHQRDHGKLAHDLYIRDLKIYYPVRKGLLKKTIGHVRAVDGVSLKLSAEKTTALVGESGCGKTTLGRAIIGLENIHSGSIHYQEEDISLIKGRALKKVRGRIQIIFQDPYSSLNPRMMVDEIVGEGLKTHRLVKSKDELRERVGRLLEMVGLTKDIVNRYPHEFSGGQRQRISIARALAVNPEMIICDEATSALDVSVQAQILNLLGELQTRLGLSYLFITHDLSLVEYLADYIYIMYLGEIVEEGLVEEIFDRPSHPYTEALMKAIPKIDEKTGLAKIKLKGDVPSPMNPPGGCRFHPRCPYAKQRCALEKPILTEQNKRKYRCLFPLEI